MRCTLSWGQPYMRLLGSAIVFLAAGAAVVVAGWQSTSRGTVALAQTADASPITHIVLIIKENHSFDNLFGRFPGVNGRTYAMRGTQKHKMRVTPDLLKKDINHTGPAGDRAIDNGAMDAFWEAKGAIQGGKDMADSQYKPVQMKQYWSYAATYGVADQFFSTHPGGSFPNHLVLISGQTAGVDDSPNRHGPPDSWGCDSNPKATVPVTTNGVRSLKFPCFNISTVADEANAAGVSWRYYAAPMGNEGYLWSAYDAISQIRRSAQWTTNVLPVNNFVTDAAAGSCHLSPG